MKTKELTLNPKNPRTITDEKLDMLKKAIEEFGDLSGIIYNRKTKQLAGGHQRRKLIDGETPITITKKYSKPTRTGTVAEGYIEVDGEKFTYREVFWSEHKEKAANIAANKGAGEWDLPALGEWMKELNSFDLDFDINLTMFDDEELKQFEGITVKEHTRVSTATGVDEDDTPETVPPRSKHGDLYLLGNHRLLCGDSTSESAVKRLLKGQMPDMVFTDPPYGINEEGDRSKRGGLAKGNKLKSFVDDSIEYAVKAYSICQELGVKTQVWLGANYYCHSLPQQNNWLVWDKRVEDNMTDTNSDCELAWVQSGAQSVRIFRHVWKGMIKDSEHGVKRVHPTQKPVALAEWCFEKYGSPNTVLDLFGGSGSTLIACEKTHRTCFMMELDPHYVDVIVERWEKYTGLKAKKVTPIKTETKKAAGQLSSSI